MFRVQSSGLRVQGSGFRAHGVQGSGFRVQGSPLATRRESYPDSRKRRFPLGGRPSKDYLQGHLNRGPNRVNSSLLVAGGR